METVILTPNKIGLPRSLISASILETLAFLLIIVILFLLFSPPPHGLNYLRANAKEAKGDSFEESVSDKSTQLTDPFSGLENIESEEHGANAQKKAMPVAYNPIHVLTNIED